MFAMKNIFLSTLIIFSLSACAQNSDYKIVRTYHIQSPGGWDYLAVNGDLLYVSHGTQVNILNKKTGDSVGFIPNTNGVHGIAFDNALGRGYTSNGRANNVTVFDLKTNEVLTQIATGENPDAINYEPFSKHIITCNGRSKNLSIIDPSTNTVVATIDVGGKPEAAVSDGNGKFFVNIEDKNEIVVVDTKNNTVLHHFSISPGEGPTGLAFHKTTKRLFAGCEKLLVVIDAENGKVVTSLPIGDGCDGVAFDSKNNLIYTSNGSGSLTVIKENNADKFSTVGDFPTKPGARTIALDETDSTIFMPTSEFEATAGANGRRRSIPGTFQVIVVKK
jgi:YVTN family beta-propeller protein